MNTIDFNHPCVVTSAPFIQCICSPLFEKTDINYFTFVRFFSHAHALFSLSTNPEWSPYCFTHELYKMLVRAPKEKNVVRYQLWTSVPKEKPPKNKPLCLDAFYGITITNAHKNYCDHCYFGTLKNKPYMHNFYVNHLDLLELFIFYFKDKADKFIQLASKASHRIRLDAQFPPPGSHYDHHVQFVMKDKAAILKAIKPGKVKLDGYNENLTSRELGIIACMLLGLSATEMADKLFLSVKAIEYYMGTLRTKLGCRKKSEIIEKCLMMRLNYLTAFYLAPQAKSA